MSETKKGIVTLFACGGAGVNIAKNNLEPVREANELGMAAIQPVYIDTSHSNGKGLPEEYTYIFEGMDGSGKVRAENYEEISKYTREILRKFPPSDLAIVLSSASGGSGSVIGPSLVSELHSNDIPVIVIAIGSTDSAQEIKNTLNTLKSYEGVAQKREKPVVMAYFENSRDNSRKVVDQGVTEIITALMTVFSRENSELDSKDLENFLNFTKAGLTTSFKTPKLVGLKQLLNTQVQDMDDVTTGNVITMVSLLASGEELHVDFKPDYQTVGYLPAGINSRLTEISPITFVTLSNTAVVAAKAMQAQLSDIEKNQKARVDAGSILDSKDRANDDGMVL